MGTKSESQVRSFYTNYKRRYHLDDVYAEFQSSASAKKKMKRMARDADDDDAVEIDDAANASTAPITGAKAEPMTEGAGVGGGASNADDSITMIDVKEEESNSSVDSFISAADAAELNEKMNARAAAAAATAAAEEGAAAAVAKKRGKDAKMTLKPTSLSVAGKIDSLESDAVKTTLTTTTPKNKSVRESTPPAMGPSSRNAPDAAPDTPDSSNEATPTRRSSFSVAASIGAAKETANKTITTTTMKSGVKGSAGGGGEVTSRPTRTSVSKTVMT